jgi:hypothetical protein
MMEVDFLFIDKMTKLFQKLSIDGLLSENFNNENAAYIIYSIIIIQFMMFVYVDNFTVSLMKDNIESQIKFLLNDKIKEKL